jgi:cytochrome c-type biogenesis protein CcmH/NrfG
MNPDSTSVSRLSFESASVWALALTAALAAVALIPSSSVPFLYTKVSILAIGAIISLALFILARLTRGSAILPPLPLVLALWLVPAAYGLSALFSGAGASASTFGTGLEPDTFGFVLVLGVLGTLAALIVRRVDQFRSFFKIGSIGLAVVVVVQLIIVIVGEFAPNVVAPTTSLIGSFSDLGMLMGLAVISILLALRSLTLKKRTMRFLMVTGLLALVVLALVNSSFIWGLVALVALGLFVESIMRRAPAGHDAELDGAMVLSEPDSHTTAEHESGPLAVSLAVLIVALFFLIGGSTIGGAIGNALHLNLVDVRPSLQSTLSTGSHTYATSALFGSGPNTFGSQWLKFRDKSLNNTVFWSIDFTSGVGYVPTSFVTTGLVGALAWLALFALFLFYGLRFIVFRAPSDPFIRAVSVISFVGAAYVFVVAVASVPGAVVLATGFIMAGIFASTLRYGRGQSQWGIAFSKSPRIGFLIVFVLTLLLLASVVGAYTVVERYLAQVALTKAGAALSAGNLDAASAGAAQSILFTPSDTAYRLQSSVDQARIAAIAADTKLSAADASRQLQAALSEGIQAALTATTLGASRYQNWLALGDMYATVVPLQVSGAYDNAKAAYTHAQTLNPSSPQIPYILAQLEIANKNNKGAEALLTQAIGLKQDYTQAIFLLSQLEVADGNAKDALAAAESAAYFSPNDPTILFQVGILRLGTGDNSGAIAALSQAVSLAPQYANARYFLAVAYAEAKDYPDALTQIQAVSDLSADNAKALAADITALQKGTNPFPASATAALGTAPAVSSNGNTTTK